MGSLEFISPDATGVAAFVIRNPVAAVEDLLHMNPELRRHVEEAEARLGFSLRDDLAASLGGEIAVAVDGPAMSWKVVAEVYDQVRLQSAIEKAVTALKRETGKQVLLTAETVNGQTFYVLAVPEGGAVAEAHYTYSGGFLVAAPNRAALTQALQQRSNGYSLSRSQKFTALLPADRYNNFSALVYQNLGSLLGAVASLTAEQRDALQQISADSKPSLYCVYGEQDRILVSSNSSLLGLGLNQLAGLGLPFRLPVRPR
jgi:hypothetical protein